MVLIQIPLEIINTQLVRIFKFSIVLCFYLYRVICQMNEPVWQIFKVKWLWTRPEVDISIHVSFQDAVNGCEHSVCAHVEFSSIDQKRFVDVKLNDGCSIAITFSIAFNKLFYFW